VKTAVVVSSVLPGKRVKSGLLKERSLIKAGRALPPAGKDARGGEKTKSTEEKKKKKQQTSCAQ